MNLRALLGYARPHRVNLVICVALMLLEAAAALAVLWLGGKLAGNLLSQARADMSPVLLGLLALFACQALLKFGNGYVLSRTAQCMLADLRIRVYDHLQALPLSFYHQRRQGDILALVTDEVGELSGYITGTLISSVPLLVTALGAVVLMFRINPLFAGFVAILIPLFYMLLRIMGRRLRPLSMQRRQAQATAVAAAEENLSMLPAIKTFTREMEQSRRYQQQIHHVRDLTVTQQRIYAALEPTVQFIAAAAVVLFLWVASTRASGAGMSPPELVSFLLYAALLTRPVSALAKVYGQTRAVRGTLERMQQVLTERPELIVGGGQALPPVRGDIKFSDISFAYPGRPAALRHINLDIRADETVALTGENGAGKSTLIHLLMRLHDLNAGQIFIDGTDIANVSLHSLRSQIGVVSQQWRRVLRTVILITHRPETLALADRVVKLEAGKIKPIPHDRMEATSGRPVLRARKAGV